MKPKFEQEQSQPEKEDLHAKDIQPSTIHSESETLHSKDTQSVVIHSEDEMLDFGRSFAEKLLANNNLNTVIELIGDVGAGKTTFVRGLANGLYIKQPITSPSFTVSKSYAFKNNVDNKTHTLTHYDFYRLNDPGLMTEDLNENIKNGHLVLVEWATTVSNVLPENRLKIFITLDDNGLRHVQYSEGQEQSKISKKEQVTRLTKKQSEPIPQKEESLHLQLDTSTPVTILKINEKTYNWESKNDLAEKLLQFINDKLQENNKTWTDIEKITFMSGPGSFTGLRIGAAVVNTLARELNIPLYDHLGNQHKLILPNYGRPANISQPKK